MRHIHIYTSGRLLTKPRLLYGLSFPMSEEAQKDDFVIPVSILPPPSTQPAH